MPCLCMCMYSCIETKKRGFWLRYVALYCTQRQTQYLINVCCLDIIIFDSYQHVSSNSSIYSTTFFSLHSLLMFMFHSILSMLFAQFHLIIKALEKKKKNYFAATKSVWVEPIKKLKKKKKKKTCHSYRIRNDNRNREEKKSNQNTKSGRIPFQVLY